MRDMPLPHRIPGAALPISTHIGDPCVRCMGFARKRAAKSGRGVDREYADVTWECGCPVGAPSLVGW